MRWLKFNDIYAGPYCRENSCIRLTYRKGTLRISKTVKPVISCHSKIEKKVLKTNGSLMKVESIAECSLGAFCNTFDLHSAIIGLENQFLLFFLCDRLRQVVLYLLSTPLFPTLIWLHRTRSVNSPSPSSDCVPVLVQTVYQS